jgi:hypothetical protein
VDLLPDGLDRVDEVLAGEQLLPAARGLLLLRVCQLARLFRPDVAAFYWPRLKPLRAQLRPVHRAAFDELCRTFDGDRGSERKRGIWFLAEVLAMIEGAVTRARVSRNEAIELLECASERLARLWWWPFGKADVWHALLLVWAEVDRGRSVSLVGRAPARLRARLIVQLDAVRTLARDEWEVAFAADRERTVEAVLDLLERDVALNGLFGGAALAAGEAILAKVHATAAVANADRALVADREKALARYRKLVHWVGTNDSGAAAVLMENLFMAAATTDLHEAEWLDRFALLAELIRFWATLPGDRHETSRFLKHRCPAHLRDFAVARWLAVLPSNQEEAQAVWESERSFFRDAGAAEACFLVTMVARGLAREALAIAQRASASGELLARVRRAVVCIWREDAAALVGPEDLLSDLVGRFLRGPSVADRVELLRSHQADGLQIFPAGLWARVGPAGQFGGSYTAQPVWYTRSLSPERQFSEFLRLGAYGQYSYADVDPVLLEMLIAWEAQYPGETKGLVERMWQTVRPEASELRWDLIRDTIFERCQRVLVARPGEYAAVFVEWVKATLVDRVVRHRNGDTIFTLSLKPQTPFLFCLLGAQRLASVSASRRDELIGLAMSRYFYFVRLHFNLMLRA